MAGHPARDRSVRCAASQSGRATYEISRRSSSTAVTSATSITAKFLSSHSKIMRWHHDNAPRRFEISPANGSSPKRRDCDRAKRICQRAREYARCLCRSRAYWMALSESRGCIRAGLRWTGTNRQGTRNHQQGGGDSGQAALQQLEFSGTAAREGRIAPATRSRRLHPSDRRLLRARSATMAHEQGALLWELRIALSLVRLRLKQGRASDARNSLTQVYDRFTEGFAIADMQTARALLDSLPEHPS